jgi:hypothetical protein
MPTSWKFQDVVELEPVMKQPMAPAELIGFNKYMLHGGKPSCKTPTANAAPQ